METERTEDTSLATTIWSLLLWVGVFLITQFMVFGLSGAFFRTVLALDVVAAGNIALLCGALASYAVLFLIVRRDVAPFPIVGRPNDLGGTTKGLLCLTAALLPFTILGLNFLLGMPVQAPPSPIVVAQQFQGYLFFIYWFFFLLTLAVWAIIAPIVEERFFRQWLWRRLEARGMWLTLAVTGAAFILIHLRDVAGMLSLLPLTMLVSFARAKTGTPRFGMWLHGINNFVALTGAPMVLRSFQ
jgi:membrane protease YdiL (CAAX protease family)